MKYKIYTEKKIKLVKIWYGRFILKGLFFETLSGIHIDCDGDGIWS